LITSLVSKLLPFSSVSEWILQLQNFTKTKANGKKCLLTYVNAIQKYRDVLVALNSLCCHIIGLRYLTFRSLSSFRKPLKKSICYFFDLFFYFSPEDWLKGTDTLKLSIRIHLFITFFQLIFSASFCPRHCHKVYNQGKNRTVSTAYSELHPQIIIV